MNAPLGGDRARLRGKAGLRRLWQPFLALPLILAACSGSDGPSAPSGPGTLLALAGNSLAAPAGTVLPEGPTFQLLDSRGNPVEAAPVALEVLEGGGRVAGPFLWTDSDGKVRGTWILGRDQGQTQRLRASAGPLSAEITAQALPVRPGETYAGRLGYVEYLPGSLPLVLTAPHGGSLQPTEIPDRAWGTLAQDRNTKELTLAIREALHARTGAYPHAIISNLHRAKLDPNREILEAAQGNPDAERAWWEFQIFAEEAGNLVEESFGEGLHLDLHGHGHEIDRLEIGYLLSSSDLAEPDEILSGSTYVNKSSVKAMAEKPGNDLAGLVRGPQSLGSLMEDRQIPAVPSAIHPDPGLAEYFTGGYNTERHGSRDGGNISAIQIEHHFPGLRDDAGNLERYAAALTDALLIYFRAHFGFELAPPSSSGK
jgi:hypothetical protein